MLTYVKCMFVHTKCRMIEEGLYFHDLKSLYEGHDILAVIQQSLDNLFDKSVQEKLFRKEKCETLKELVEVFRLANFLQLPDSFMREISRPVDVLYNKTTEEVRDFSCELELMFYFSDTEMDASDSDEFKKGLVARVRGCGDLQDFPKARVVRGDFVSEGVFERVRDLSTQLDVDLKSFPNVTTLTCHEVTGESDRLVELMTVIPVVHLKERFPNVKSYQCFRHRVDECLDQLEELSCQAVHAELIPGVRTLHVREISWGTPLRNLESLTLKIDDLLHLSTLARGAPKLKHLTLIGKGDASELRTDQVHESLQTLEVINCRSAWVNSEHLPNALEISCTDFYAGQECRVERLRCDRAWIEATLPELKTLQCKEARGRVSFLPRVESLIARGLKLDVKCMPFLTTLIMPSRVKRSQIPKADFVRVKKIQEDL